MSVSTLVAAGAALMTVRQASGEQRLTRDGQVTDRYTAAVTNLGDAAEEARIGGMYALQRIAQDSPRDASTVAQVLAAYIRDHTSDAGHGSTAPDHPANDVATALSILTAPLAKDVVVDLHGADLHGANVQLGYLQLAYLDSADLHGANLVGADLESAHLYEADLHGAHLEGANLAGAQLADAHVQRANLGEASLDGVLMGGADLAGANLAGANLHGADLSGANLAGANLKGTNLTDVSGYKPPSASAPPSPSNG